ncbi:cytochrome C assembly family protein [Candidatus Photodesmus blepharus]|nr:cytochrome c biogenesis protein CcsA [Candidatus Photodesmus blepharus]
MNNLIAIITAGFYTFAIVTIVLGLLNQTSISSKTVLLSVSLALAGHGLLLSHLIFSGHGQNLSILNVASLISFIISIVMSFGTLKTRLWFLLPLVYGFSVVNLSMAVFLPSTFITHLQNDIKLLMHTFLALSSYSTLTVGALYALQLTWLDCKLKSKKALAINPNTPPLMVVERQLFKIVFIGTVFLTGTLLTGSIFIQDTLVRSTIHKSVLSSIAWVIYSTLLLGHYYKGWRGKKITWFSIVGAMVLTFAYFGSRFVREVILQ